MSQYHFVANSIIINGGKETNGHKTIEFESRAVALAHAEKVITSAQSCGYTIAGENGYWSLYRDFGAGMVLTGTLTIVKV